MKSSPLPSSGPVRILLVDDNRLGLTARKAVLEELGYPTVATDEPHAALAHFRNGRFDLVITDYKMPQMNGLELIAQIRRLSPETPVILISGFAETLGLNEANTDADIVIQKSANEIAHLLRAVGRLTRKKPARKPPASQNGSPRAYKKA